MEHRDYPPCATCRRNECKNKACGRITYRATDNKDWPCPSCGGECHVLLTQHRSGVCRHGEAKIKRRAYRQWGSRNVG